MFDALVSQSSATPRLHRIAGRKIRVQNTTHSRRGGAAFVRVMQWCSEHRFSFCRSAVLLSFVTTRLCAQAIGGRLWSGDSTTSVGGAIVVARDSLDHEVGRALSDKNGRFFIPVPPQVIQLRIFRIGYRSTSAGPYTVPVGAIVRISLGVNGQAVQLDKLVVSERRTCRARESSSEQTLLLWEEARKALLTTSLTRTQLRPVVTMANYERVVAPGTQTERSLHLTHETGETLRPYASAVSPEVLASKGYVQASEDGTLFRAPDAEVLLSDSFAAGHCFGIEGPTPTHLMALTFAPREQKPGIVDVVGKLWLDVATAELREMEFQYVARNDTLGFAAGGGRMRFAKLPSDGWVISDWSIEVPRIRRSRRFRTVAPSTFGGSDPMRPRVEWADSVEAIYEFGGRVVRVVVNSVSVWRGDVGELEGIATQRGANTPISDAVATLLGTDYRTATDTAGQFRLEDIPTGRYRLEVRSARLASLGLDGVQTFDIKIEIGAPAKARVQFLSPSASLASACGMSDTLVALRGIVVREDGTPANQAQVSTQWLKHVLIDEGEGLAAQHEHASTVTDSVGRFRLCGLPAGRNLRITARMGAARDTATVHIAATEVVHDVRLVVATGTGDTRPPNHEKPPNESGVTRQPDDHRRRR